MDAIGDYLFAFGEWLHGTWLADFAAWLTNTSLSMWFGTYFWSVPIVQVVHILSIGALFGAALMFNLRILGLAGTNRSIAQAARRFAPWIWWPLLVLTLSGLLLIIGEPNRELINPVFWVKMALVAIAAIANLGFQRALRRRSATWEAGMGAGIAFRLGAILLIMLWLAIIFGGRWIAYAPV